MQDPRYAIHMTTTTTPARYILRCGAKHTTRVEASELEAWWDRHGYSRCHCGRSAKFVGIAARYSDTECGARCRNAIGPSCDCKCGGEHHSETYAAR